MKPVEVADSSRLLEEVTNWQGRCSMLCTCPQLPPTIGLPSYSHSLSKEKGSDSPPPPVLLAKIGVVELDKEVVSTESGSWLLSLQNSDPEEGSRCRSQHLLLSSAAHWFFNQVDREKPGNRRKILPCLAGFEEVSDSGRGGASNGEWVEHTHH